MSMPGVKFVTRGTELCFIASLVGGIPFYLTLSAIGGAHTLLEAPSEVDGGALKVVPVLTQLWLPRPGKVNEAELALLINRAHGHATLKLGLQPGSYYVALYVMNPLSSTWKDSIPRGTIVIDAPSMERVMKPFGVDAEKLFECLRVVK